MNNIDKLKNIPEYLIKNALFCNWKYEERNGKKTKIPYTPFSNSCAKSNDPSTFRDFNQAIKGLQNQYYHGIGVGIFDEVCAIDIDSCVDENGHLSVMALEIVKIMDSYTEYSPSRKGIHILFLTSNLKYDDKLYRVMNKDLKLEVYVSGTTSKYVTVTGDRIGNQGFGVRNENLIKVLDKYMKRPVVNNCGVNGVNAVNGANGVNDYDDGLPELAFNSRNGHKFKNLWEGDITGYPSHSEADLALCLQLAFWTGKDISRMDELFRQSGLMREKWDRKQSGSTYGQITLNNAISRCLETYSPSKKKTDNMTEFNPLIDINKRNTNQPDFPVDAFPTVIAEYVKAASIHTQTPIDMAATIALGVLAVCLQGKFRIEGSPGYFESLSLYTVVVANPGERKSSIMNDMTECLYDYVDEYNTAHATEIRNNQLDREKIERKIFVLTESLKKEDNEENEIKLRNLQEELDEMPVLKPLRLVADDCSSEALVSLLADNNGRFAVLSTEGGIFDIMAGRYSQKPNIDVWLKGHSGDPIMIDRLGRSAEMIKKPHLSAILTIQPSVLDEIMSNKRMSGRGLLARFLYSLPISTIGNRTYGSPAIPDETANKYKELINRLLELPIKDSPETLSLSSEAAVLMQQYFSEHEKYLANEGQIIIEWAGKYIGAVLRIAGLISVVENPDEHIVTEDIMTRSISIGKYFLAHAVRAFSLIGTDDTLRGAKYILGKIKAKNIHEIKQWELAKECRSKMFPKPEDIIPALQLLEENGYIRIIKPEDRKGPGRKPDAKIVVNPLIYVSGILDS